jgi:hypothetical protein
MATSVPRRTWVAAALAAGLVAGITLDAFEILSSWRGIGPAAVPQYLTWVASIVVGNTAEGASWAPAVGVVVSLGISILWAYGYVSAAQRQRQLITRPLLSGIGFGIVAYLVMEVLLVPAGKFVPLTVGGLYGDLLAYTLFFGVPLAEVVARFARAAR